MTRLSGRLVAAITLALTAGLLGAPAASADPGPGEPGFVPGPINAGNTWKWGKMHWREEFEPDVDTPRPVDPFWKIRGAGLVQEQHGMLTLNTTSRGNVSATLQRKGRKTGRWEIRLRSRSYGTGGADYRVITQLIPTRKKHCGGRDILLEDYQPGDSAAGFEIHTLPDRAFVSHRLGLDMGSDVWHTFAVEITKKRISWFVDAQIVNSETRPEALSHARYKVKFLMQADGDRAMNQSRMQMDWLRYWTLKRPGQKSVVAPLTRAAVNPSAC